MLVQCVDFMSDKRKESPLRMLAAVFLLSKLKTSVRSYTFLFFLSLFFVYLCLSI